MNRCSPYSSIFGTLVGGNGVFQGELVQAEFLAQSGDGLAVGRLQFDPDEVVGTGNVVADVVKRDRLDFGIVEEQAVDDGTWRHLKMVTNSSPYCRTPPARKPTCLEGVGDFVQDRGGTTLAATLPVAWGSVKSTRFADRASAARCMNFYDFQKTPHGRGAQLNPDPSSHRARWQKLGQTYFTAHGGRIDDQ